MPTLRYALYDATTGQILAVLRRSDPNWIGDTSRAPGQAIRALGDTVCSDLTHYFEIHAPVSDDIMVDRPVNAMGSDMTIEGDGSTQSLFTNMPTDTKVYRNFELIGTYTTSYDWAPVSPGDNGLYRFDLEPPFPDQVETYYITVIDP